MEQKRNANYFVAHVQIKIQLNIAYKAEAHQQCNSLFDESTMINSFDFVNACYQSLWSHKNDSNRTITEEYLYLFILATTCLCILLEPSGLDVVAMSFAVWKKTCAFCLRPHKSDFDLHVANEASGGGKSFW